MQQIVQLIGDKWVLPILSLLFFDDLRFSRLKKELKITSRTLSRKLKRLEEKGIVQKMCNEAGQTAYCLTHAGKDLFTNINRLFH
jgi:DNA-binding HxlR family transcriptional regulator